MNKLIALLLLGLTFAAGSAMAADAVVGSWALNVAKSKFASGPAPTSGTRVYTEADGGYDLDQKITGSDGKEVPFKAHYKDGENETVSGGANGIDSIRAKRVNAHTWDFSMMSGGKEVGHVHRTVSSDGKTLTVHNTGKQPSGATGSDTMVFDKK